MVRQRSEEFPTRVKGFKDRIASLDPLQDGMGDRGVVSVRREDRQLSLRVGNVDPVVPPRAGLGDVVADVVVGVQGLANLVKREVLKEGAPLVPKILGGWRELCGGGILVRERAVPVPEKKRVARRLDGAKSRELSGLRGEVGGIDIAIKHAKRRKTRRKRRKTNG